MNKIFEKIKEWLLAVSSVNLWLCILGMFICTLLGVLLPKFAEWPIVPLYFAGFFISIGRKGTFDWGIAWYAAGVLIPQILFWIA